MLIKMVSNSGYHIFYQYCPKRLRILINAYVSVHPEASIVEFRNSILRISFYAPMGAFGR